jgi:hypothetical protein
LRSRNDFTINNQRCSTVMVKGRYSKYSVHKLK